MNRLQSNAKKALMKGQPTGVLKPGVDSRKRYATAALKAVFVPLLLLLDLTKRRPENEQRFLIFLFFVVFGFTFILGGDAIRHMWRVEYFFAAMTIDQFFEDLWRMLTFRTAYYGANDVYNHTISFFFGRVLSLPQLYIPFVAAFYGYFYAGSVVLVLRHMQLRNLNYVLIGFVLLFLLLQGLQGVQTVRTWTGMWVLVFACLKYYETGKRRYLFLMFTPPLFHFGYWLMAIPAWIVLVYGSRPLLYTALVAISSFTTFFPEQPATSLIERTERGAASLVWYRADEQVDRGAVFEEQLQETNWYNAYRRAGLHRWAPIVLVLGIFSSGLYSGAMTFAQKRIFSIGVLTLAFSNMTWFVWAVHNRTLIIASVFILAGFLMVRFHPETARHFRALPPYYQWALHLSLLLWLPQLLFAVSVTFDRLSVFSFIAPFLVAMDASLNLSMKEFLNLLLGRG